MRMMRWRTLSAGLALGLELLARGAEPDFHVSAESITEHRYSRENSSTCNLQVKFSGKLVQESKGVLETRVIKAVNNLGEDVTRSKPKPYEPLMALLTTGARQGNILRLQASHRQARNLTIEGEADLFYPTATNGGLVIKTNFINDADVWLQAPELTRANVKVMFVGREHFDTFFKAWREQNRGPYSTGGNSNPDPRKCALRFRIEGKVQTVARVELEEPGGKLVQPLRAMAMENYLLIDFPSPPPTEARLLIYLAVPEARRTVPFKLENVALP